MKVREANITSATELSDITEFYSNTLKCLLKIFALNYDVKQGSKKLCILIKKFLIAAILGLCTLYILYYKMVYIYNLLDTSVVLTDFIQMIYDYCQFIVDLYFVFKYGRETSMEYYSQYTSIDKMLGVYHTNFKRRVMKMVFFFALVWITSSVCDFTAWIFSYGWTVPLYFIMSYVYLCIKMITILDLISHIIQIESRVQIIGDLLQDYYHSADNNQNTITDCISNSKWLHTKRSLKIKYPCQLNALSCNRSEKIKWLSRCYLVLIEQTYFINNMYGVRIILNSLSLLIDMVRFTNIAVRIVIGKQVTTYSSGYFPAISSIIRMLACAAVFVGLVHHCERVYRQTERIILIIDHLLINKNLSDDVRTSTTELLSLVQSRPLCFNMAHFFRLNYSFLLSTASVVVTYTIILLQNVN